MNSVYCLSAEVSVSMVMAIVDFIPVVFFMIAMGAIIRVAYLRISSVYFAILTGGVFLGFFAGLAKCTWKLIYAIGYDFVPLNSAFVIYQTVGFFMIAVGSVNLLLTEIKREKLALKSQVVIQSSIIPLLIIGAVVVIERPSFFWFIFMALFTCVYLITFSLLAFRKKRIIPGLLYYVSMLLMFVMVGLKSMFESGGTFEQMNWIAQVTNVLTQCLVIIPTHMIMKNYPMKKMQILQ